MNLSLKSLLLVISVGFFFSVANASELNLSVGESVQVGGTTVNCGNTTGECSYLAGNVYCGVGCKYLAGNVYCADQAGGECSYLAGNVYCGIGCKYLAGNVYCVRGGIGKPAVPAKP